MRISALVLTLVLASGCTARTALRTAGMGVAVAGGSFAFAATGAPGHENDRLPTERQVYGAALGVAAVSVAVIALTVAAILRNHELQGERSAPPAKLSDETDPETEAMMIISVAAGLRGK